MSRRRSRSHHVGRRTAAVAAAAALMIVSCGEADQGATVSTRRIVPDSTAFAVRPPVTTVAPPPTVAGEDGEAVDRSDLPGVEHIVQDGDYGLLIAERYGVTLDDLVSYNGWDSIASFPWPGEVIRIPPVDPAGDEPDEAGASQGSSQNGSGQNGSEEEASAPGTTAAEICESSVHTIASGDYPLAIAEDYDVAVEDLLQANLGNPDYAMFAIGGEIVIPC